MFNIRNGAIRWQTHDFRFNGNANVCFIYHHLRDIRKSNKMSKCLTLKMKVKVMEETPGRAIRLKILDFFSEFCLSGNIRFSANW